MVLDGNLCLRFYVLPKEYMVNAKRTISIFKWFYLMFCVWPLFFSAPALAQCDDKNNPNYFSWDFDEGMKNVNSIGTVVSNFLTPQIILDTKAMRDYIRDERFLMLRSRCGDMHAIDAIYLKSLKIADYNIVRALFLSCMAVTGA